MASANLLESVDEGCAAEPPDSDLERASAASFGGSEDPGRSWVSFGVADGVSICAGMGVPVLKMTASDVHMSMHVSVHMSTHMPIHLPTGMSAHMPMRMPARCPYTCLCTCLHTCLHT